MKRRTRLLLTFADLLWASALGFVSGLACVAVRLFFRLLQWLLTGQSGLLSHAAEELQPLYRVGIPILGALAAMAVTWGASRSAKGKQVSGIR